MKDLLSWRRSRNWPQLVTLAVFLHSLSILELPLLIVHDISVKQATESVVLEVRPEAWDESTEQGLKGP